MLCMRIRGRKNRHGDSCRCSPSERDMSGKSRAQSAVTRERQVRKSFEHGALSTVQMMSC